MVTHDFQQAVSPPSRANANQNGRKTGQRRPAVPFWKSPPPLEVVQKKSAFSAQVIKEIIPGAAEELLMVGEREIGLILAGKTFLKEEITDNNDYSEAFNAFMHIYSDLIARDDQRYIIVAEAFKKTVFEQLRALEQKNAFPAGTIRGLVVQVMQATAGHDLLRARAKPAETKESGKDFRWPVKLWQNEISKLPGAQKIAGNDMNYKFDESGGLSFQPPEGREMKKKDSLIAKGAWKSEITRKDYILSITGGVLKDAKGTALSGPVQYVLSEDWLLYGQDLPSLNAEKEKYGRSSDVHTRYLAGDPARSAGWIVAAGGKITRIGNDSGHYGPHKFMLYQLLTLLKDGGVDLSGVTFHDEKAQKSSDAREMYDWMKTGAVGEHPKTAASKGL
jgi:hypothetical protein